MLSAPRKRASLARIAITMGDPCGIGPEIIVKAFAAMNFYEQCQPVVIGDRLALERAIDTLGAGLKIHECTDISQPRCKPGFIELVPASELTAHDIAYRKPTTRTAQAIVHYIETAVRSAVAGDIEVVVTCPIHKANLHQHGFPFPGHTEFLCHLTQVKDLVMMLAGPRLRVSLATIHHPLASVPLLLTREKIEKTIQITGLALLRDFGLESPRIAVAALNPHAGEEGRFGGEEKDLIQPALECFRDVPYHVSGPYAPDTVFFRALCGEFDAVIAMYHDQGLIPIKLVHFHEAVNVTLGSPIIRTSVDHGTAYDIAGTGKADPGSLEQAIQLGALMARNRHRHDRLRNTAEDRKY
jgi:4-hydroxythreonine-4-phosphate dehydrogenase